MREETDCCGGVVVLRDKVGNLQPETCCCCPTTGTIPSRKVGSGSPRKTSLAQTRSYSKK
ncbi:hypothetical protein E2C01_026532 [Portunus trituberculatus]|uniref:Uncharacterized protein n=1 Tax=Portunus trituberculatus TaxID=210409 RepID=A0A5B7EJ47_PORTR|nr:hypothetical protein [Portunus trituberculatus]